MATNITNIIAPNYSNYLVQKNSDVAICYLNPVTETLVELGTSPNDSYNIKVEPFVETIVTLYAVIDSSIFVNEAYVSLEDNEQIEDYFDLKVMVSGTKPRLSDFSPLTIFNTYTYTVNNSNVFIPIYLYVYSKTLNSTLNNFNLDINYT